MKINVATFLFFCFITASLLPGQSMRWIFLNSGSTNVNCTSISNCNNNVLCYGLQYRPATTGIITSYTTGFFVDCTAPNNGNGNPIVSNASCIMTDNSVANVQCTAANLVLLNSSGNSGTTPVVANVSVILHQICLDLSANQSVNIVEDELTNLTVSIDEAGGGPVDELPSYTTFNASYNAVCSIMAVELATFSANKTEQYSVLKWETAMEIDNDYFSVEWSKDGQIFQEIGKVSGAGTSNHPNYYQFIHERPAASINYYRLKAIEFDGDADYSPIRYVQFEGNNKEDLELYPNPATDQLSIRIPTAIQGQLITIEIRNLAGQLMYNTKHVLQNEWLDLPLVQLPSASYLLILKSAQESMVSRFVKAE